MDLGTILANILAFLAHFNISAVLGQVVTILTGVIALFMLVPGDQPEKFLQGIVDWIKAHSN